MKVRTGEQVRAETHCFCARPENINNRIVFFLKKKQAVVYVLDIEDIWEEEWLIFFGRVHS